MFTIHTEVLAMKAPELSEALLVLCTEVIVDLLDIFLAQLFNNIFTSIFLCFYKLHYVRSAHLFLGLDRRSHRIHLGSAKVKPGVITCTCSLCLYISISPAPFDPFS